MTDGSNITYDQLISVAKLQRGKKADECLLCPERIRSNPTGWLFVELVEGEPARLAGWAALAQSKNLRMPSRIARDGSGAIDPIAFAPPQQEKRAHWARLSLCPGCRLGGSLSVDLDHLR